MRTPSSSKRRNVFGLPDNWEDGKEIEIECFQCGKKILHNEHLAKVFLLATCCDECANDHRKGDHSAKETRTDEMVASVIPPLYLTTEQERLPFPDQIADVLAWRLTDPPRGLWVVGDTRTGKTRSVCLLLERLLREGIQIRAFFHGSFSAELLEVIRSDRNFRRWKTAVAAVPVVVIDDLFAEKMTERTEAALFELIDERIANHRPTIVTTQVTGGEAKKIFHSMKRGEAFFARVKEFFHLVRLGDKQTKLFAGGSSPSPTS